MLRKSRIYATYNNKEFETNPRDNQTYLLRSYNTEDEKLGFVRYEENLYIKIVNEKDITELYQIEVEAEYRGFKFSVINEKDGLLLISTMKIDYRTCEDLGFEIIDRGVYQKWVSINDLSNLKEIKTIIET